MKRALPAVLLAATAVLSPRAARADETDHRSVFAYTSNGIGIGALVGLSAGYLVARDPEFDNFRWQPLAMGAGIGAIAGGALGLTLGIVDMASDAPPVGSYVLRDTALGAEFGTLIGLAGGAVAAASSGKKEHILFGAAIGTLAGSGLGVVLGAVSVSRAPARGKHAALPFTLALGAAPGTDGAPVWMPVLAGCY